MKNISLLLVGVSILTVCGCSKSGPSQPASPAASAPAVQASPKIADSFSVKAPKSGSKNGSEAGTSGTLGSGALAVRKDEHGNNVIYISKEALEKEFLLQANLTEQQSETPQFYALKSRIVAFRLHGDKLVMLEATKGHEISGDIPKTLVLAQFPVVSQTDKEVGFDFNAGMSAAFLSNEMHGHDLGRHGGYENSLPAITPRTSYLDVATVDSEKNRLSLDQIAQFAIPVLNGQGQIYNDLSFEESGEIQTTLLDVQMKYYISPYQPDPTFTPTLSPRDTRYVNFFEANPILRGDGRVSVYASKYNLSKPVVFAISDNTPKEFRDSVREGILYWNKVFGREVVQVIDAPKGVTAPSMDYNIIQWSNHVFAAAAYAQMQTDPRTGEVMHSQVYMPSGFANFTEFFAAAERRKATVGTKPTKAVVKTDSATTEPQLVQDEDGSLNLQKAVHDSADKELIGALRDAVSHKSINGNATRTNRIALAGFDVSNLCSMNMADVAQEAVAVAPSDMTEERIHSIAQDMVRQIVSHEVGHTFGLRHNFAGSMAANFDTAKFPEIARNYVKDGSLPSDLVMSSSVMDYFGIISNSINGALLKRNNDGESWDKETMALLYDGKTFDRQAAPLYCSDPMATGFGGIDYEGAGIFDCRQDDVGHSAVDSIMADSKSAVDNLAYSAITRFQFMKSPEINPEELRTFEGFESSMNARMAAVGIAIPRLMNSLFAWDWAHPDFFMMMSGFRIPVTLNVFYEYPGVYNMSSEEGVKAEAEYGLSEIKRLGGLNAILPEIQDDFGKSVLDKFNELINLQTYRSWKNVHGEKVEFTDEDIKHLRKTMENFTKDLDLWLARFDVLVLNYMTLPENSSMDSELVQLAQKRLEKYVYALKGQDSLAASFSTKTMKTYNVVTTTTVEKKEGDQVVSTETKPTTTTETKEVIEKVSSNVPVFRFPLDVRGNAAALLASFHSKTKDWGTAERKHEREKFEGLMKSSLGGKTLTEIVVPAPNSTSTEYVQLTPEFRKWLIENTKVLQMMSDRL